MIRAGVYLIPRDKVLYAIECPADADGPAVGHVYLDSTVVTMSVPREIYLGPDAWAAFVAAFDPTKGPQLL